MTPKEKATQIVDKIFKEINSDYSGYYETSKSIATIMVDEIINIYAEQDGPPGSTYRNPGKWFWMQVKIEINKL